MDDGTDATPSSALRQALLAVLVVSPGQARSRKSLQSLFWGDSDGDRAAANLRTALYLLRQDLAALVGEARVWTAPLPAGVVLTRRLRVEILVLQARPDRGAVWLEARWTLSDATGNTPPRVELTRIEAPTAGTEPDALVAAHRLALWRLAEQLAAALR